MTDVFSAEDDFKRDIWCVLGLPVDKITIEDTCEFIDDAVNTGRQRTISTTSLNFVVMACKYRDFRMAVIDNDLSIIDGIPVLWVARFLGFPLTEMVQGSTLVEYMLDHRKDRDYKVFFFGGKEGMAEQACRAINRKGLKITAAGCLFPGYGSVEDMSQDNIISRINEKSPDILLAALGAKKGILWIARNRDKLNAKMICHVGAAVNFIAGVIKRAPEWMQRSGLEWVWRMLQEPVLFKRYFIDGVVFLRLFFARVLPYRLFLGLNRIYLKANRTPKIRIIEGDISVSVIIGGVCNYSNIDIVRQSFQKAAANNKDVRIDFSETEYVDNSFLGQLLVLAKYQRKIGKRLMLVSANDKLKKIFKYNLLEDMLNS